MGGRGYRIRMIGKSRNELLSDMERRLKESIPELEFGPGSVVRAIITDLSEELAMSYDMLSYTLMMTDLSVASGIYLDMLGQLVGVRRNDGEADTAYRARVAASELLRAQSNELAIRLECLAQPFIRDIVIHQWSHGPGSCTIYVISTGREFDAVAVQNVQNVLARQGAAGIRFDVVLPRDIEIDLALLLIFADGVPRHRKNSIISDVRNAITWYIVNLLPGNTIRDTDIIKVVRNASSEIIDMDVIDFAVNDVKRNFGDVVSGWNERFTVGKLQVK
ncbi:MAG TPA: hypothetical protein GX530_10210 [Corynebacteriales bacterium]|nr:hypothetical protein [Mycobacteriales bacterium]